jgi:FkbM family methyltransferase
MNILVMNIDYQKIVYVDPKFLRHLEDVNCICEVGARHGYESIALSQYFPEARILSFECNPNTVDSCRRNLTNCKNITFFDHALGLNEGILPFYSFSDINHGASSFYKRVDFDQTQELTGYIPIKTLKSVMIEQKIDHIDLLCMDVQGFELNILKGLDDFIKKVSYIILEEPANNNMAEYLPEGSHSYYVGAPTSEEIHSFLKNAGFIEVERIVENAVEDNVMYRRQEPSCLP